eukprot:2748029-Pleurochrysis_carterae.AAC.1
MAATRALRWCLLTNYAVTKRRCARARQRSSRSAKKKGCCPPCTMGVEVFSRLGSQTRWVGDHQVELKAALVFTELAFRFALEVALGDLGDNLNAGALINSDV